MMLQAVSSCILGMKMSLCKLIFQEERNLRTILLSLHTHLTRNIIKQDTIPFIRLKSI